MIIRLIKTERLTIAQIAGQTRLSQTSIQRVEEEIGVRALRGGQGKKAFMGGKLGTYLRK